MAIHARKYAQQHKFDGELRIKVNRRLYPDITEDEVMELAQSVLEGENVPGIMVQTFEVRGDDKTGEIDNYAFASQFMRSATRTSEAEKPHRKKSKAKH